MSKKSLLILTTLFFFTLKNFAQLADPKATDQTKNLFNNLLRLKKGGVLIGHQDDLAYGVGWAYTKGRSDIKALTGQYPAVLGWDLAGLEKRDSLNIDGVPFARMAEYIRAGYDMGSVNTLSWHMDNPLNGKTAWDTTAVTTVKEMLPGGIVHQKYTDWLDRFAVFNSQLIGADGKMIPILFRPFHEHSGGWFWWGSKTCSPEEYKQIWKFTVHYLRDVKQVHNLIYVFNPSEFSTAEEYLNRYPGNDAVDVLSFDTYQYGKVENGGAFSKGLASKLKIQDALAKAIKKVSAVGEMGYMEIPDPKWWSGVVWKGISKNPPAFILLWRNAGFREKEKDNHYYAPYKGHASANDFLKLVREKVFLLQRDAASLQLYTK